MLARLQSRQRVIAIRTALGASRFQLVRPALVELRGARRLRRRSWSPGRGGTPARCSWRSASGISHGSIRLTLTRSRWCLRRCVRSSLDCCLASHRQRDRKSRESPEVLAEEGLPQFIIQRAARQHASKSTLCGWRNRHGVRTFDQRRASVAQLPKSSRVFLRDSIQMTPAHSQSHCRRRNISEPRTSIILSQLWPDTDAPLTVSNLCGEQDKSARGHNRLHGHFASGCAARIIWL